MQMVEVEADLLDRASHWARCSAILACSPTLQYISKLMAR